MNEFGIFGKLLRLFHINASEYGGALTGAENMWHAELTGKKALDDLARRYGDDVVYHGSGARVAELEPRQMSWYSEITDMRYPDGDPAVAADAQYDKPMFLALFKGRRRCAYVPIIGGRPAYVVGEALTPEGQDITKLEGYVYVLERRGNTSQLLTAAFRRGSLAVAKSLASDSPNFGLMRRLSPWLSSK